MAQYQVCIAYHQYHQLCLAFHWLITYWWYSIIRCCIYMCLLNCRKSWCMTGYQDGWRLKAITRHFSKSLLTHGILLQVRLTDNCRCQFGMDISITFTPWIYFFIIACFGQFCAFNGYDSEIHPGISQEFQTAAMRFGHTLVTSGLWLRLARLIKFP